VKIDDKFVPCGSSLEALQKLAELKKIAATAWPEQPAVDRVREYAHQTPFPHPGTRCQCGDPQHRRNGEQGSCVAETPKGYQPVLDRQRGASLAYTTHRTATTDDRTSDLAILRRSRRPGRPLAGPRQCSAGSTTHRSPHFAYQSWVAIDLASGCDRLRLFESRERYQAGDVR
jgi:hypothetical protein